jgi:quercetin dioxygenase-like cupin family protein
MHEPGDAAPPAPALPPDDPGRTLVRARADDAGTLPHLALAGDTYTVLLTGADTGGRFTLIDMYVPPGGGPPPHRHDFDETFSMLEGEIEFTFRGAPTVGRAGDTINVPANAPHAFRNASDRPARMLCICAPAGQDAFFLALGARVESRTAPAPPLSDAEQAALRGRALALAPQYRTEFVAAPHDPPPPRRA